MRVNGSLGLTNEGFRGMGIKKGLRFYDFSVMYRQPVTGVGTAYGAGDSLKVKWISNAYLPVPVMIGKKAIGQFPLPQLLNLKQNLISGLKETGGIDLI